MIGTAVSHHEFVEKLGVSQCTLIALVVFLSLSNNVALSQHHLSFDRITQREGLSNPSVLGICRDVCGAMWFGTDEGAERYDGYKIRTFKIGRSWSLAADEQGFVWIGNINEGLYCYDIANDTLISYAPSKDDPKRQLYGHVGALYMDRSGALWVALSRGVAQFDTKKREYLGGREPFVPELSFNNMTEDNAGNLWLASTQGVAKFEKRTGRSTIYRYTFRSIPKVTLAFGKDGKLWVAGGPMASLVCFDTSTHEWKSVLLHGAPTDADDVNVDDDGYVWVATATHGLKIYDPRTGHWEEFYHHASDPQSLASDRIGIIYRDKIGNMWFGSRNGVSKLARWRKQFWAIPHNTENPNSPPKVPIRSICEDRNGNLWIGSMGDGIKVWNRQTGVFKEIKGISPWVNVIHVARSGWLWIGTSDPDCLTAINPLTGERKVFRNDANDSLSIPKGHVEHLYEDSDGSLWVGTQTLLGIGCFDPRTEKCLRVKTMDHPKEGIGIIGFYRDREGRLWAALDTGMVEVVGKTGRGRFLQHEEHWEGWEWKFLAMHEDRHGRFWVGTEAGFGLLDRSSGRLEYVRRDQQAGQSSATHGILEDDHENLWLMTADGLSRFCPSTGNFRDFGIADGYPPAVLSVTLLWGTTAYCRTKDGLMVFGTGEGIVLFHPDSIQTNPNPPGVLITDVRAAGMPVHLRMKDLSASHMFEYQPIELHDYQNSIVFEFAALDYTAPSRNAYAYKLEGLENQWSPAGNMRNTAYVNLSPGTYTFRVKAANNDGVWNEKGASVQIIVLPPWWMTWWCRALVVLVGIGVIVLIMQLRIRRALAQERIRLQIASDLHDDIGSSLSSIALASESARDILGEGHPALRVLDSVASVSRQAADRLKDDVWIINPGADTLDNLLLRMKDATRTILGTLPHSFRTEIDETQIKLNMPFRRNVLLVHKEALHNVLKHAGATHVEIVVREHDGAFTLDVADDGSGFDPETARKGNGLSNMRRRAAAVNGDLQIASGCGQGTRIVLTARIP
jgi:ligand-binding sensor domain-containing protein